MAQITIRRGNGFVGGILNLLESEIGNRGHFAALALTIVTMRIASRTFHLELYSIFHHSINVSLWKFQYAYTNVTLSYDYAKKAPGDENRT
jgi:hypothetical protein